MAATSSGLESWRLVFADERNAGSLGQHFIDSSIVVWSGVPGTTIQSALIQQVNIKSETELRTAGVLVLNENSWIRGDHEGQVDFLPARVRDGKKWVLPDMYKDYTFEQLRKRVSETFGATRFAAHSYWGRPAIRAVIPPNKYTQLVELAKEIGMEFRRVSESPVSVAKLTVKVVKGSVTELPFAVATEVAGIKQQYPTAGFGKQTHLRGQVEVLVYIDHKLKVSDHRSAMTDGIRRTFTTSFERTGGAELGKEADEIADAFLLGVEEDKEDEAAEGDADIADADIADRAEKGFRRAALEAEADSLRRAVASWKALCLPVEVGKAALAVLKAEREANEVSLKDVEAIEERASYLALCPTPAMILEARKQDNEHVVKLREALEEAASPPAINLQNDTRLGTRGPGTKTYAQAARGGRGGGTDRRTAGRGR